MKIDTRLGKTTKIGYTTESRTSTPVQASSKFPSNWSIDINEGVTPMDTFMTSQNPLISFARGFLRGLGIVAKMLIFCILFVATFMFWMSLFG